MRRAYRNPGSPDRWLLAKPISYPTRPATDFLVSPGNAAAAKTACDVALSDSYLKEITEITSLRG
jgi:hypothetical protein